MTRHLTIAGLLALVLCTPACQKRWSFEPKSYYDPLSAGVRDANVAALGLAFSDSFSHQVKTKSPRQVWDIDLGIELPIIGWESQRGVNSMPVGAFGVGFWIPIDFHMIEDFEDDSKPIINTDYRFGGMFKLQYRKAAQTFLSTRLFIGHESTHLGDEFSLAGQREHPGTFERINVSWEYIDLGVQYQRDFPDRGHTLRARLGLTTTVPFNDSYYSVDAASATQSAIGPVIESHNSIDPYFGFEYVIDNVLAKASGSGAWSVYLSTEIRYRSVYDYHRASADVAEDRQPSINVVLGIQKPGGRFDRVSPFLRIYQGVNPHGQFRNQKGFTLVGAGLRLQP
ncbi:MAG: DUF1207 domain-containing protein [Longimicrobiales bacterium]